MADRLDAALISAAGGGDREAFGVLVERHHREVMRFVFRFLGLVDRHTAEDLVQDVFLSAWRAAPRFRPRPGASVFSWLLRIATNTCLNYRRDRRLRLVVSMDENRETSGRDRSHDAADAILAAKERALQVQAAVADLPPAQRAAIVLREYHGLSYTEIADAIGTSVSAVESLLVRARRALSAVLSTTETETPPQVSPELRVECL